MSVTLSQIAKRAGVSRQTASNILNTRGHLFLPATRERVFRACEELGYRPNAMAKALRSGRFNAVGLVSARMEHLGRVAPGALLAIEQALDSLDMHLVQGFFRDAHEKGDVPRLVRELFTDALIVNYGCFVPAALEKALEKAGVPVVWMNLRREWDAVYPDDFAAGYLATQHLIEQDHRRIAWVNLLHSANELRPGHMHYSFQSRLTGYETAMKAAGLRPAAVLREESRSRTDSVQGPFPWLEGRGRPTAVVFAAADAGLGPFLYRAGALGLTIPRDLSLVTTTDGEEPGYGFPVDFVEVPHARVGRRVVDLVVQKLRQPRKRHPAEIIPPLLHARRSSQPPPRRSKP